MKKNERGAMLVAYVDPSLIRAAKAAAEMAGLGFSQWVARAIRQTMSSESIDRAFEKMGWVRRR